MSSFTYLYGVDDVSGLGMGYMVSQLFTPLSANSLIINLLKNSLLRINQLHIINKNILKIVTKRLGIMSSFTYLYIYQTNKRYGLPS